MSKWIDSIIFIKFIAHRRNSISRKQISVFNRYIIFERDKWFALLIKDKFVSLLLSNESRSDESHRPIILRISSSSMSRMIYRRKNNFLLHGRTSSRPLRSQI